MKKNKVLELFRVGRPNLCVQSHSVDENVHLPLKCLLGPIFFTFENLNFNVDQKWRKESLFFIKGFLFFFKEKNAS